MAVKAVTQAVITGQTQGNMLIWAAGLFLGQRVGLWLSTENPGPACPVDIVLTGIEEAPATGRSEFLFRGSFFEDNASLGNLATLGLPKNRKFEGRIKLCGSISGELNIV